MADGLTAWHALSGPLLLSVPLVYALAAAWRSAGPAAQWSVAQAAAGTGLALALVAALAAALGGGGVFHAGPELQLGQVGTLALTTRLDALTAIVLALVCFVGLVILGYSRRYLDGDPGQVRYARWFSATLAAVSLLVVSNNLLLLAVAWIGTSLALHPLLTFYPDRPQALIAAHKKFLASRVADLCLLSAIALVGLGTGSLELDVALARIAALPELTADLEAAAVLFAASAALKCAQLPFHGWLIQVMEAPTPVSALLHAGIVNVGGFLMIRLSPLLASAEAAQLVLVAAGTATAVVAALVMTTRVSIKVALAWSTCAQMGFMLLQCGLGAWSLALLHLVAHSLYKAHAFLGSGSAVEQWRIEALRPKAQAPAFGHWLLAGALAPLGVVAAGAAWGARLADEPALWALATIVALALTPLLLRAVTGDLRRLGALTAAALAVPALYFGWHALFAGVLALPPMAPAAPALAIVLAGFALLWLLQAIMGAWPQGRVAQSLYPRLYAGLYLDELFTRLTFRVWPARLPARQAPAAHELRRLEA
jgi:NAD(P)H-quinone oxidoreductase subunit 5